MRKAKDLTKGLFAAVLFSAFALNAEPVARIDGGSSYESLAEAFSAAADGDVVELLSDVELTSAFTATGNKTVTLRGGAHTLSSTVAIKNYTAIGTSANENFRITDGFKLVIDGGNFTNLTFSAVSTGTTAATTSTVTVEGGVFKVCEFFAINNSSKVTVNGGDFKGGTILARSYNNSNFTSVEINGGVFNDLLCCVRPYDKRPDVFNIYSGVFTNCTIKAMNGTTSSVTIGDPEESSTLRFVDSYIYSEVAYKTATPTVYINRGHFENCAIEPHNTSNSGENYGTATLQVSGGDFAGCKFSALVRDSSSLKGAMTSTLKITGGSFSNGYIRGDSGDGKSYTASPTITIQGGEFDTVPISVFSGISTAKGYLTVSGGTFKYCLLATWGRVNQGTISGGVFNGCKIGAFAHQRYSGCDEKMTISSMTANGCLFFAKVTGGSGSNTSAKATTAINGGTFIGCTSMTDTDATYTKAYVTVASGVSLNGTVANVGATGYSPLSAAFATLQSADTVNIDLAANSYTPISSTHQVSPARNWTAPVRSTDVIDVASGKSAQVSADGYIVDANFSAAGVLVLDGGYYTGAITPQSGGSVRATVGTKFKNEPVGVLPIGSAAIQVDENGDYVVEAILSLSVVVSTDAAQMYGADDIQYGTDTDVTSGTAKTYTAPAIDQLTETTRAACTGWSLYVANSETGENDLVRESSSGALAGEDATTCIATPETSVLTLVWHWKIQHYVTLASEDPAKGGVSGAGWYDEGAQVAIAATPATYYEFMRWTGDTNVLESATAASVEFALAAPVSLTAEFRPAIACNFKYVGKAVGQGDAAVSQVTSETLVDSANGIVECSAAEYIFLGGTENHRALCIGWDLYEVVNDTDVFVRASTNTTVVVENTTNALVSLTGEMKIVWNWEEQYFVTAGADARGGGSVTGGGWNTAAASFQLTAVPNEGYKFLCWAQNVNTAIGICSQTVTYNSLSTSRLGPYLAVFVPEEYDTPDWLYLPEQAKLVQMASPHWAFAEIALSGSSNIIIPKSADHVVPDSLSDLDFTGTIADVDGNAYFLYWLRQPSSGTFSAYEYNLFGETGSTKSSKVRKLVFPESFRWNGDNVLQKLTQCTYFEFKGNLGNGFNSRIFYNASSCQRIRMHHFPPNVPNASDWTFWGCGAANYKFRIEYPDFLESAWLNMTNHAVSSGARYDYKNVMSSSDKASAFTAYKAVFGSSAAEPKGYAALNYRKSTPTRYCALVPYTPEVKPGKVALGMMGLPYALSRTEAMTPSYGYHEYNVGSDITIVAPRQFTEMGDQPYLCKGYVLSSNPAVTNRYSASFTISGAEAANIGLTWIWKPYSGFKGLVISVK